MEMQRRRLLAAALAGAGTVVLAGCGGGDDPPGNIVEVAQSRQEFSILVEAVVAADLAATLSAAGPFTVFAPTNDAFAALLAELGLTKAQLLADKALLTAVLTYHVLPGRVDAAAVAGILGQPIATVQGGVFKIESAGGLKITDGRNRVSTIVATNVPASNGVIHAVDRVLLPANTDIVQAAQATPSLSLLVEAVVAAGLAGTLAGPGPFTVFAPTNDAFAALLAELGVTKDQLFADVPLLTAVLTYHVVPGRVLKAQVPINTPITTVQGAALQVGSDLVITDARGRRAGITATDIFTSNGVVHLIDRVILPPA
jgi:uncharacterized surface protein with fasciclin (FAS1) repeats